MSSSVIRKGDFDGDIISEVPSNNADILPHVGGTNVGPELHSSGDRMQDLYNAETLPPKPNNDYDIFANASEPESNCLTCCCLYSRGEGMTQLHANEHCCITAPRNLRKCLSSACFYICLLISTFFLVLLLLTELLLDVGILVVPDERDSVEVGLVSTGSTVKNRSLILILHWFNFSILSLYLFEVMLRLLAWRTTFIRSLIAVFDAAVVVVAFSANLLTTVIAGYDNPFNAISLLIILRFMRIYNLIQYYVIPVRRDYRDRLNKTECFLAELQVNSQRLMKQISERDYEIKQLQAHLSGMNNQRNVGANFYPATSSHDYETELEKVLALSKKEYEEETGQGHVNPSFVDTSTEDILLPSITIHHRENSIKRERYDRPSTSKDGSDGDFEIENKKYAKGSGSSHGHVDGEGEVDTASLLRPGSSRHSDTQRWTVGYCVIQDCSDAFSSAKLGSVGTGNPEDEIPSSGEAADHVTLNDCHKQTTPISDDVLVEDFHGNHKRSFSSAQNDGTTVPISGESCTSTSSLYPESGYQSDDRPVLSASSTPKRKPLSCIIRDQEEEDKISISSVLSNNRSPHSRSSFSSSGNVKSLDFNEEVVSNNEKEDRL